MPEKPHPKILNETEAAVMMAEHYQPQLDLLSEFRKYSSNLGPRAFESSPKMLPDLILCYGLVMQLTSMLDAVDILMRAGAVHASFAQIRIAFEVSLQIQWMLQKNLNERAVYYYVGEVRRQRIWGLRAQAKTPEYNQFIKDLGFASYPGFEQEGASHAKQADTILALPEYASADAAFEAYKKKTKRPYEPAWYKVLGVGSVAAMASQIGRRAEYAIFYSKGSEVVHSSTYKDHFKFGPKGATVTPVRNVREAHIAFENIFSTALQAFRAILEFYRPDELPAFAQTFTIEWRDAYRSIKRLKLV
jgi:hypothetical protein